MLTSDISVEYVDHMGSDLSVVNAARVSFDKESEWTDIGLSTPDTRLIQYLAKHKHYSPFNHTFLSFRIKAPIFVARQLVKHEYLPWNEVSRRYVDSEPEFYFPPIWRAKAENVKQGSTENEFSAPDFIGSPDLNGQIRSQILTPVLDAYNSLIENGMCAEQARMILPQNMMTEWIWSGTLKAFHKMLSLRLDSHTQYETRIVAEKILPIIEQHFPISIKALLDESE